MYAFDYSSTEYQVKSNLLFQATRPIEKQKETETDRNTQNHKQTEGQTDKSKLHLQYKLQANYINYTNTSFSC